ncbi:MAG TPA: cyclic nucleotide-binding protein [Streptococcus sp.]|nr:cyclic nucleotide-binding protein [Streptococcus sp.]
MQVKRVQDYISKEWFDEIDGSYFERLNSRLQVLLKKDYPDLQAHDFISNISLLDYRLVFLDEVIANANEKNEHVRKTVHDVNKGFIYEDQDIQEQLDSRITFGQKVADDVARFGGSWTFILSFVAFMAIWMALNVVQPFGIAFDKYPFILLNLALSTLAAVQAPLIMMSQNRASDYDRLQARNDYHVNNQSKEEIRLLHEKIDHLVQQDQSDLLTIQKLQTQMIMGVSQQVKKMSDDIRVLKEERLEGESHGNEKN